MYPWLRLCDNHRTSGRWPRIRRQRTVARWCRPRPPPAPSAWLWSSWSAARSTESWHPPIELCVDPEAVWGRGPSTRGTPDRTWPTGREGWGTSRRSGRSRWRPVGECLQWCRLSFWDRRRRRPKGWGQWVFRNDNIIWQTRKLLTQWIGKLLCHTLTFCVVLEQQFVALLRAAWQQQEDTPWLMPKCSIKYALNV